MGIDGQTAKILDRPRGVSFELAPGVEAQAAELAVESLHDFVILCAHYKEVVRVAANHTVF